MEPKRGNDNLGMRSLFWECDPTNIKSLERVYNIKNIYVWKVSQIQGTSMYETICTQNSIVLLIWQYKH